MRVTGTGTMNTDRAVARPPPPRLGLFIVLPAEHNKAMTPREQNKMKRLGTEHRWWGALTA
jgi:hypothetical protein